MSQDTIPNPYAEKRSLRFEGSYGLYWWPRRNLFFRDHSLREDFYGRAPSHSSPRPFGIERADPPKTLHLKFRPRRVLDFGGKTWDIYRPVPNEPDYHLGAMRLEKRKVPRWVLLNWEDVEIGVFRRHRERGLRFWRNTYLATVFLGRQYEFVIDHRIHGTLLRSWGVSRVHLRGHFNLAPRLQSHAELLAGAFVLMVAHPDS